MLGVTGGIGSGKSTVCRVFGCLGIPVYNADERAKWLIAHHPGIRSEIVALLGPEAYTAAGLYDSAFVSAKVFQNSELLSALNRIVHPRVGEDTRLWVAQYSDVPYLVKEAAIMTKAGTENGLDYVLAVLSPEPLRVARVLSRDPHRSKEQVASIIGSQASEQALRQMADFVVYNNEQELLIPQVLAVHDRLLKGK